MDDKQIKEQIAYLNEELSRFDSYIDQQMKERELNEKLINDLKEAMELKKGNEIIVPVSKGIFMKLTVDKFNGFLVNVGSNVMLDKDYEGVKKILDENIKVIDDNIKSLKEQENKIINMIETLNSKIKQKK